jgi:hypothetical protein
VPLEKAPAAIAHVSAAKDKTKVDCVRPELAYLKVNVDAICRKDCQTAWGSVIRDHHGLIVFSAWNFIPHCQSVAVGEAIACLEVPKMVLAISSNNLLILEI